MLQSEEEEADDDGRVRMNCIYVVKDMYICYLQPQAPSQEAEVAMTDQYVVQGFVEHPRFMRSSRYHLNPRFVAAHAQLPLSPQSSIRCGSCTNSYHRRGHSLYGQCSPPELQGPLTNLARGAAGQSFTGLPRCPAAPLRLPALRCIPRCSLAPNDDLRFTGPPIAIHSVMACPQGHRRSAAPRVSTAAMGGLQIDSSPLAVS
jgi:hypothetical protein